MRSNGVANKKRSMDHEEHALIKEAQRGNLLAFDSLVHRYDKTVLRLAYSLVNNTADAEDIGQEVFVRVYRNLNKFRFDSAFSTWLYRVVVNYCINYRKKKSKARTHSLDEPNEDRAPDWRPTLKGQELDPEASMLNQELSEQIDRAMAHLSKQQKTVFVLRHYHGLKLKDIADIMQCAEGTVKNYLFRATQKMQSLLGGYLNA